MRKYNLVVDCGIPYEEKLSKKALMKELRKLEEKQEGEDPYCDVWVYKGKKDITDSVFKKYRKKKRKR